MSTHETGPEEQAAEVLAGHCWLGSDEQKIDGEWTWGFDCECGEFVPDGQTNAHLAKALAPLFAEHARQAKAEALREAAERIETDPGLRLGHNVSVICSCLRCEVAKGAARILRERADTYAEGGEQRG